MTEVYLKDIKHDAGEFICKWYFIDVPDFDVRVYYKSFDVDKNGFSFYAVIYVGHQNFEHDKENVWNPEYTFVECLFQGVAFFDGVRHLYMGDEQTDNEGYHYYPNLETNIAALKIIRELEIKYCKDID